MASASDSIAATGVAAEFVFAVGASRLFDGAAQAAVNINADTITSTFFMISLLNLLAERMRSMPNQTISQGIWATPVARPD
jgi:hypothetical protein